MHVSFQATRPAPSQRYSPSAPVFGHGPPYPAERSPLAGLPVKASLLGLFHYIPLLGPAQRRDSIRHTLHTLNHSLGTSYGTHLGTYIINAASYYLYHTTALTAAGRVDTIFLKSQRINTDDIKPHLEMSRTLTNGVVTSLHYADRLNSDTLAYNPAEGKTLRRRDKAALGEVRHFLEQAVTRLSVPLSDLDNPPPEPLPPPARPQRRPSGIILS